MSYVTLHINKLITQFNIVEFWSSISNVCDRIKLINLSDLTNKQALKEKPKHPTCVDLEFRKNIWQLPSEELSLIDAVSYFKVLDLCFKIDFFDSRKTHEKSLDMLRSEAQISWV